MYNMYYSCEHVDSLVAKTYLNGVDHRIAIYCGSKQPPMLMSSGTSMTVVFKSMGTTSSATGFNATYHFVTGEPHVLYMYM